MKAVSAGTTTNLVYDPLGRLFEVNQGSSATTTRFLNDGDAMVAELNSSNVITNRFVHGSNAAADDPLVWYLGSTMTIKRWPHADHLGSIVAVTNSSGGSPSINRYDEYGVPASTNIGRFQYTGQAWIGELGLYYYKARFYSPALGRFMQTDPVGYEGGMNLYAYVGNDPVNAGDPTGLYECAATEPQCKSIARAVRNIGRAAETYRPLSTERRALNTVLKTLGREGQDTGVTIKVGPLEGRDLGKTEGDRTGATITLDFDQINRSGGLAQGSVVLGHEGVHAAYRLAGVEPNVTRDITREEQAAYIVGGFISRGIGFVNPVGPNHGEANFLQRTVRAAEVSCARSVVTWEREHWPKPWPLEGSCR